MPVITNLLFIELAILSFFGGIVAIAGIVYRLTREDLKKSDRVRWLVALAKAVVGVFAAVMSGGIAVLLVRHFFRVGPSG